MWWLRRGLWFLRAAGEMSPMEEEVVLVVVWLLIMLFVLWWWNGR
jgi:hypothetical protein